MDVFQRAVADLPNVQSRQMFGYPAVFTKTQMFAGLFQDKLIVRLSDADREAARRDGARPFEPMPGRPMREYVVVPEAVRAPPSTRRAWPAKAHTYAASLPPKKKKESTETSNLRARAVQRALTLVHMFAVAAMAANAKDALDSRASAGFAAA